MTVETFLAAVAIGVACGGAIAALHILIFRNRI